MKINNKGFFITLSFFFLAILLISANNNLNEIRQINEDVQIYLIASSRTTEIKNSFFSSIKSVYNNSEINFYKIDNNFIYEKRLLNSTNDLENNLINLRNFLQLKYPLSKFNFFDNDIGKIQIVGKDLNITNSLINGFENNDSFYINFLENNIKKIVFEIDFDINQINNISNSFTICNNCVNFVEFKIVIRNDENNVEYYFLEQIDIDQDGVIEIKTINSPIDDSFITFDATNKLFSFTSGLKCYLKSKLIFFDSSFFIEFDENLLEINDLEVFGFTG